MTCSRKSKLGAFVKTFGSIPRPKSSSHKTRECPSSTIQKYTSSTRPPKLLTILQSTLTLSIITNSKFWMSSGTQLCRRLCSLGAVGNLVTMDHLVITIPLRRNTENSMTSIQPILGLHWMVISFSSRSLSITT